MADELLSQEEINLLLKGLGKEEEKKRVVEEEKVKPLDLNLFEHISAGRVPGLELIFEKWISGLRRGLTSLVVTIPSIFKESVNIVKFGDLVTKLPMPCAIGLFNIEPLRGVCLLIIEPKLVYIMVSSVFGGSAKPSKVEDRDFTRIEIKLIQKLLNVCYQELEIAWGTVMNVKISPVGMETNPALLTVARSKEKFLLLKLLVVIEGSEGYIYLAIPDGAITPYKDMLKGSPEVRSKGLDDAIFRSFQKVPIKLEVLLGEAYISLRRLMELKEGDTITLDKPLREPLEIRVEGLPKLSAFLGQLASKKALKIQGYLKKED
ncbi:MAG: FliM/FliN family flagellar motor switch protein [Aquificaceae bacterium]|nr:FliM/FliN family flagellar motor switch protein [Aquificaceae bacterium]MCS7196052.1 FliM/FliN family flagellar motor switch protein [Aquificaceae bacterium]MCX7990242.1 FliM/FliN family flagellar motor switch protein [Aquificaceae bacterium]MDW8032282.1 FliM/FliN family flagellar motor switch protein [Aquificaceae bacterium]MDW8294446.1 FliM/FliN family flagellar motor switch protein [Aquificaceae bacterium]